MEFTLASFNRLSNAFYRYRSHIYVGIMLLGLYILSISNYLLFHTFSEMISVAIAGGIFMLAWNSRHFSDNGYLLFLGISFLFIGGFDLVHGLAYKGTGIFPGTSPNLATQLWIASRYMLSIAFLISPLFLTKKLRGHITIWIYSLITYFIILSIFYLDIFPTAYGPNGLTPFKKISEYIIITFFFVSIFVLEKYKNNLPSKIYNYLIYFAVVSIVSEFFFTIYIGVYDFYNMAGHLLKIIAYVCIYKAVVESNLKSPYSFLFKNLKENEEALKASELKFRSLITGAINPVILADKNSNIILWNEAATKTFGYNEDEAIGKPISMLFPEKYRKEQLIELNRISGENNPSQLGKTVEVEGLDKNGKIFPADIAISSWKNNGDIFYGAIIRDISSKKDIEKKLNNALTFSQGIVDTVWQPLIILDKNLKIFSANKSFYDFFQINRNIEGRYFYEIDKKEWDIDELKDFLLQALETKQKLHGLEITRNFPRIGKKILLLTANPLRKKPSATESNLVLLSIENVTYYRQTQEKMAAYTKQLEHEKAEDEALLSSIGDGIVAVDEDGKIVFVNEAFENLTGVKFTKIRHKNIAEAVPLYNQKGGQLPHEQRPTLIAITTGQKAFFNSLTNSLYIHRKDGAEIPVAITAAPIMINHKITGAIAVWRDITKEKNIDKAKSEFISLASHQLRTPLTSINLSSEMILNGIAGDINEDQREYLNNICRDVAGMAELIDALLNVSRIELGTFAFDLKPTNVLAVADSAIKEITNFAKTKNITIVEKFPENFPMAVIDKNLLKIVFQNLTSNAVKYTPEDGKIEISIECHKPNFLIKVADNGYGIPQDQQDKVFLKMFRASNVVSTGSEGIGLGLYAIKSLVEQIGGNIWFESKENKGTTFFVELPLEGQVI